MEISKRAREIQESPIRKLAALAVEAKKKGKKIYHLNIGQPDIATPDVFYKRINEYSEKVLAYGPSDGLPELKTAMCDYFNHYGISLRKENINITNGGSEALLFIFNVIADPGDEIIIPEPFYTNYNGFAMLANVRIVPITTHVENGFQLPAVEEFEKKITPRTKAILVCSPNNPTGAIFSRQAIEKLGQLVKKHNLYLIADEVYKEFTYDGGKHFSVLELDGMDDRVLVADSISKRYSSCGARIGAVICRNPEIMAAILKFGQARLCPPTLGQIGAVGAYHLPHDYFQSVLKEYQERRDVLHGILSSHRDIQVPKPAGAFYMMARLPIDDGDRFARWMINDFQVEGETVMVAPGDGFYSTPELGKQEIRLAYVLEVPKLKIAGRILLQGLDEYRHSVMKI